MNNLWDPNEARTYDDPVDLRAYSSRLLGREPSLVLHGGGNTSVKVSRHDLFGGQEEILYVKGSGWDLASIKAQGFAPVRLEVLEKMARLDTLSDSDMVRVQRAAMIDPDAPNPSVEAILHAIIPHRYVDHTHADAVVTISNTPQGAQSLAELYGDRVLLIPYVMPGFLLAKAVAERIKDIRWDGLEGIILLNHGVFTFGENAKESYDRMIALVTEAEAWLKARAADEGVVYAEAAPYDALALAQLRRALSERAGKAMLARLNTREASAGFASRKDLHNIAARGPVTPDHVIRTKRLPLFLEPEGHGDLGAYEAAYDQSFKEHAHADLQRLDPAPRWGLWPGVGSLAFGATGRDLQIIEDISRHTMRCIQWAEAIDRWQALPAQDIFEMEYWELEQAKLKKAKSTLPLTGRVALVTGAASGIGAACATRLQQAGAAVVGLDLAPGFGVGTHANNRLDLHCDLRDGDATAQAVKAAVTHFGGIDLLISNAGTFPPGQTLDLIEDEAWQRTLTVNLTTHQSLLRAVIPYLRCGLDPRVVFIASKNVPAPGAGVGAYSVAKAGLTQLARVAALELGSAGVRVNVVHPNQVFDTGIWSEEKIKVRAAHYGLSEEAYRTHNVLGTAIRSADVAETVLALCGPGFSKTTGAQIPVDGGSDRVI